MRQRRGERRSAGGIPCDGRCSAGNTGGPPELAGETPNALLRADNTYIYDVKDKKKGIVDTNWSNFAAYATSSCPWRSREHTHGCTGSARGLEIRLEGNKKAESFYEPLDL